MTFILDPQIANGTHGTMAIETLYLRDVALVLETIRGHRPPMDGGRRGARDHQITTAGAEGRARGRDHAQGLGRRRGAAATRTTTTTATEATATDGHREDAREARGDGRAPPGGGGNGAGRAARRRDSYSGA